ncbi:dihydrodipicolinate synthase family protein [Treponema sp. HNW]|uniref:dihydrodipicolinate synthase family protein n=1 Tax=Treponema sp. HNW TaxID=3116654 RepID=UPI003D0B9DDA
MIELHGIIPYLVSPIDRNGLVITSELQRLCSDLIDEGVHGLCVLGSCGEFPYLTLEQKKGVVITAVNTAAKRVPVVAGVCGFSVMQAKTEAKLFTELGVDAVVIMLEKYFSLSPESMAAFYRSVAESIPCVPCVLYSNPKFMHFEIPMSVFEMLSDVPNIIYYKEASGVTGKLLNFKNLFNARYKLFSASAHIPLFVSMLGGVGWMAGPACLAPKTCIRLYELSKQGNIESALELQQKMWLLNDIFLKFGLTCCVKAGLEYLGYKVGAPIPPLEPLSSEQKEILFTVIDSVRVLGED